MLTRLLCLVLSIMTSATALAQAETSSLQDTLDAEREESRLIGLAAVILKDGQIVEQASSGLRKKKEDALLQPTDTFHIGSIGKSISATAIARLVERGELDWDDRLIDLAPTFADMIDPGWHDVTLDLLLSHRGSLPAMGIKELFQADSLEEDLPQARRTILKGMLESPPETPFGEAYAYRNSGYALASLMVEEATGRLWEDIVREEVAAPLSLESFGFGPPQGGDAPWGHRKMFWMKFAMVPTGNSDNPPFMSAAGTMHMSLQDLARYGQAHLTRDPVLLSLETYEHLHTPRLNDYGYGWIIYDHREWAGGQAIWHNGSNTMWYALLALAPEKDMVIAIASNDGDIKKADPAFGNILRWVGDAYPD